MKAALPPSVDKPIALNRMITPSLVFWLLNRKILTCPGSSHRGPLLGFQETVSPLGIRTSTEPRVVGMEDSKGI